PPTKKKYGHYTNTDVSGDAETWMADAAFHEGSWWPRWESWLRKRSGKKVTARVPGGPNHASIAPAPGTYVRRKANQ
ncbi:MAG: class I poly(R)-hydroxyalkanoic acid synthase, partial [Pseudomonadota bacterium]